MRLHNLLDVEKEDEEILEQRELNEVSINGSVKSLLDLLHKHPLILNKFNQSPSIGSDSPLHISALLGHLDLTRELLTQRPELAGALNSHGSTALHVASAKGYVEIVKELVLANPGSGFVLDLDGRSPLHLAAIKGRIGVLSELVRVDPEMSRVLTTGGESCLHLCVKYNQFEGLKVLLESLKDDEFGLVNWKDKNGNNVLHLAVANKQIEMIKFLITNTEINAKSPNANGFTTLDILSHGPRDLRDMQIKQSLKNATSTLLNGSPQEPIKQDPAKPHKHTDWTGRKRSTLMIVASLLATTAFQAGISPPGGVWQDNYRVNPNGTQVDPSEQHDAGQSVMAYRIPIAYGQFMIFNTIAFLASLSIILLLVSGLPMRRRRWMWTQMVTMWVALTAQTITYFITLIHMTPNTVSGRLTQVMRISVLGWLSMMGVVFIGNVARVIRHFLMKYGYIEWKEKEHRTYTNDEEDNDEI